MNLLKKLKSLFIGCGIVITLVIVGIITFYLYGLPALVNSPKVQKFADKKLYECTGVNIVTDNLYLDTTIPYIVFKANNFELIKDGESILALKNIDTKISLSKILQKKVIIKRLGADYIFTDVNKVLAILPQQEEKKEPVKTGWYFDFMDSTLYLNQLKVNYSYNDIKLAIDTKNIKIDNSDENKQYLHFDFNMITKQGKNIVHVKLKDENKIYISDKTLYIEDSLISLNKSKLHFKGFVKDNNKYSVDVFANDFNISNIVAIIESNVLIPNGAEMLTYFNNIHGHFNFRINANQKGITGNIDLEHLCFLLEPVENVPVHIHRGKIQIDTKNIYLKDFGGYYGTRPVNTMKFAGTIKNYMKTFETHITADGVIADDFAKYYLTPVVGIPLNIVGTADTKLFIDYINNKINLKWLFRLTPEDNLLIAGEPLSKYKEKRVVVADMTIEGMFLRIKKLNYYVTVPGVAEFTRRKLISLHGLIDFSKGVDFRVMGFEIERPVPSGFLNIIARQEIFKDGTAFGKLTAVDGPKGVKLFGNLTLDKIKVPSQRLYVHHANISTNFNNIDIKAEGGYRRAKYSTNANIVNNLAFPIIVNRLDFSLDKVDIEKMLASFNMQGGGAPTAKADITNDKDEVPTFDITNLIIKDCKLKLGEAVYKDLIASNMEASMTLSEKGDLDLNSNRFDFAKGQSSAHVCCDLKNHLYHVKLGVKDVDSNLIATTLLNLPKEISGKASGIIDLNTDDKLKLNGDIKFLVKKGTIGKIGLIEYVLNVASVFRNPIAMISPMTIFDLINVPNGEFDKIQGSLKIINNLVEDIKIKSYAPYLSAYIAGNYNLEKQDATLRIYTKLSNKKKGVYGWLRNISLGNLASRVSLGARNDVNYYSSEITELPNIDANDSDAQIFLTTVDGDIEHLNFLSSLKKLK